MCYNQHVNLGKKAHHRSPAKLARQLEHVPHQRTPAHVRVVHLGVLAVLGAEHPQPLAVRLAGRVVKVAKHRVALDAGLEDAAEAGLAFVLVEALLHVPDGGLGVDFVPAGDAVHGHFVLGVVVVEGVRVQGATLRAVNQQVQFGVAFVQLSQGGPNDGLLLADRFQGFLVLLLANCRTQ